MSETRTPPGGNEANAASGSEADDRERRLGALRALASQQSAVGQAASSAPAERGAQSPVSPRPDPRRVVRRPTRALTALSLALVVVVVVAGVVGYRILSAHSQAAPSITAAAPIVPSLDAIHCESDVAWSPDGRSVALLGHLRNCPNTDSTTYANWPGEVNIYDTTTGKLVISVNLDTAIQRTLHLGALVSVTPDPYSAQAGGATQVIQYQRLAWSPDGKRLAITFQYEDVTHATPSTVTGVEIINADGSSPQVVARATPGQGYAGQDIWNLATGAELPLANPTAAPEFVSAGQGVAALSYRWGSDGALTASQPLPTTGATLAASAAPAAALGPIGNPAGGANFTIWQAGQLYLVFPSDAAGQSNTTVPGAPVYYTEFVAWSPDGRYLLDASLEATLVGGTGLTPPSTQTLQALNLTTSPALAPRDAALRHLLTDLTAASDTQVYALGTLAWSPSGNLLAAVTRASGRNVSSDSATVTVTVMDCATGRVLKTLVAHAAINNTGSYFNSFLRWSPDGKRLLYFSDVLGSLTTWGPGQVPQG